MRNTNFDDKREKRAYENEIKVINELINKKKENGN